MNAMDFITWDLWWKNNRYDMVNGETIKMDKFDRLKVLWYCYEEVVQQIVVVIVYRRKIL